MKRTDKATAARVEVVLVQFFENLLKDRIGASYEQKCEKTFILSLIKKNLTLFFENELQMSLYLEIFTQIDGCHPLLLEKWTLSLSFQTQQPLEDLPIDLSSFHPIENLLKTLPKLTFPNLNLNFSQSSIKPWPKSTKTIEKSPKLPIKIQLSTVSIEIFCEFLSEACSPEIKMQNLGARPRLSSIEIDADLDVSSSADSPMVFLNQMTLINKNCSNYSELTTKNCTHEHNSIGFTPLSHTICSENASFESENECFGQVFEVFGDSSLTEDAEISVYKINCDRMNKVQLFREREEVGLEELKKSLWRMRGTLDLF